MHRNWLWSDLFASYCFRWFLFRTKTFNCDGHRCLWFWFRHTRFSSRDALYHWCASFIRLHRCSSIRSWYYFHLYHFWSFNGNEMLELMTEVFKIWIFRFHYRKNQVKYDELIVKHVLKRKNKNFWMLVTKNNKNNYCPSRSSW